MSTGEFSYEDVVKDPALAAHLANLVVARQDGKPTLAANLPAGVIASRLLGLPDDFDVLDGSTQKTR